MNNEKIKVLYIAGWGRSGSTILARILGQIDGFFHGGELRTIWVDGLKPKGICGCGMPVKECSVWTSVFEQGFGGVDHLNRQEITKLRRSSEPKTQEVLLASFIPQLKSKLRSRCQEYLKVLEKLYQSIANVTSCKVIVDDSLHPGYAYTLSMMPNIDLYLVHLIRDSRGCAYSWLKPSKHLGNYSVRETALGWNLRNISIEVLALNFPREKYLRIYYEDFVRQPEMTLTKITQLIGEDNPILPLVSEDEVNLGITHSVFGNPNRSETGVIKLSLDEKWKTKLNKYDLMTVNALSFPFLFKYGYFSSQRN